jgi:hypothetical protein
MSLQSERTRARNACLWKLSILLLLAGLVSVSALAKNSFEMPRSSPSHWVSQACKMREGSRVAAAHPVALQAVIAVFRCVQPSPRVIKNQQSDPPPSLTPDFFRHTALRAPPIV